MIYTDTSLGLVVVPSSLCLIARLLLTTVNPKSNCSAIQPHHSTPWLLLQTSLRTRTSWQPGGCLCTEGRCLPPCPLAVPHWLTRTPYPLSWLSLVLSLPLCTFWRPTGKLRLSSAISLDVGPSVNSVEEVTVSAQSFAGSTWRWPCSSVHLPLP